MNASQFVWLLPFACLLGLAPSQASAQSVGVRVLIVLASEQPGSIATDLKSIRALRKPPFSAFKSMKVLSKPKLTLAEGKPVKQKLPNGRSLKLEMLARMPDGRIKVRVSVGRSSQKDLRVEVLASPGEPFFVAGQKYQGGTLVIGVRVER